MTAGSAPAGRPIAGAWPTASPRASRRLRGSERRQLFIAELRPHVAEPPARPPPRAIRKREGRRRRMSSTAWGQRPSAFRPGRSGSACCRASSAPLGPRSAAAPAGRWRQRRVRPRPGRAPAGARAGPAVVHDKFDEVPVSPDLRRQARECPDAGRHRRGRWRQPRRRRRQRRLQARAALAEEREHRQPADEAGQGGEEGIAGADHHAGRRGGHPRRAASRGAAG